MIHLILYAARREDGRVLLSTIRDLAAMDWSMELDYHVFYRASEAAAHLRANGAGAICWDMTDSSARAAFLEARPYCREAFLMVIATSDTSPLTFLNPDVAPSSLLFRPLNRGEAGRAAREMLAALKKAQQKSEDCFTITWKDGQQRIPYRDIYYFEARERKLYARMRGEEVGFSGTIERLEQSLPPNFLRCHRSYIVNAEMIERVLFSQGMIAMWDGLTLPLSRSYKKIIKEYGERRHGEN